MNNYEPKKLLILRILTILEQYSDIDHQLKHTDIMEKLKTEYNTDCERKAIGRNIAFLKDGGYPIVTGAKGVYLENRLFESSELRLLIDSILASRHVNARHSKQIIEKLNSLGGVHFKKRNGNIRISEWDKCSNFSFFLNIEMIDEAIDKNRQIEFIYNRYGTDKKLHPRKDSLYKVNPYHMLLHNQRYYLVCNTDKYDTLCNFRIDRITDISILDTPIRPSDTLPSCCKGLNPAEIVTERPYMFSGNAENIIMEMDKSFIGDIIDWFGENFHVRKLSDNKVEIRLKADLLAMRFWALQYGTNIEITAPEELRETISRDIKIMAEKYNVI